MDNSLSLIKDKVCDLLKIGLMVFDNNNDVIQVNKYASDLLDKICSEDIILTLADLEQVLKIEELDKKSNIIKNNLLIAGVTINIVVNRITNDENHMTVVQLFDITGQGRQIKTIHEQTSDLLWKVRSRIAPVQNALSILLEYGLEMDEESTKELLGNSHFEIWQLERILDNFRDISLLNANTIQKSLTIEPVVLSDIINEAIENIKDFKHCFDKKYDIIFESKNNLTISCDKMRMLRIIESLLINSLIYSNEEVDVNITVQDMADSIVLAVKDNGFGIPKEDVNSIFLYSFRGENANKTDFNGLGWELYLARTILMHINATISFQNNQNNGVTFEIVFKKD